jgi:microcompartment protein CcmL/EutN
LKDLLKRSLLLLLSLQLTACALTPLAVPVAVSGSAAGVGYTLTNVAYKTISRPHAEVEAALRKALRKMDIKEKKREVSDGIVKISAETEKLTISIELEKITPTVTKISVDAVKSVLVKDKATATEIIVQTEKAM